MLLRPQTIDRKRFEKQNGNESETLIRENDEKMEDRI